MLYSFWYYISECKEILGISIAFVLILSLFLQYQIKRFSYTKAKYPLLYLLYQISVKDLAYLVFASLYFLCTICCIILQKNISDALILYFLLNIAALIICAPKKVGFEIGYAFFLLAGLLIQNVMFRYLQEVRMEVLILLIYLALNFFIVLYAIYLMLWHLQQVSGKGMIAHVK